MKSQRAFPNGFIWGAGTSAYQIEGGRNADGKGDSIWDRFVGGTGKVQGNESAKVACDHYQRLNEDVELMRDMSLGAYRFSVSWPRILPDGKGNINARGLDFYDRLVDQLLSSGIQPWVTLYHWDFPHTLMHEGGWLSSEAPRWFGDFVAVIQNKLGDRVNHWITLNEPNIFVPFGFERGLHAPGLNFSQSELVALTHNLLCAHGIASRILRNSGSKDTRVGSSLSFSPWEVSKNDSCFGKSKSIAEEKTFEISDSNPFKSVVVWADPMFFGSYADSYLELYESSLPSGWEGDIESLKGSVNFCALNIYASAGVVTGAVNGQIELKKYASCEFTPKTLFQWPVTPEALYWGPYWMFKRYGLPVVVTENGMSAHDWMHEDGKVHDNHRIDFTSRYLGELYRSIEDKILIEGYFHWSFIDNFEWAEGYRQKFGLVYLDRKTLKRTLKDSGIWYSEIIQKNALPSSKSPHPL